jgi:hypothetical protein
MLAQQLGILVGSNVRAQSLDGVHLQALDAIRFQFSCSQPVLAAYNTGLGEDGTYTDITSLARALVRAGVPSVVTNRCDLLHCSLSAPLCTRGSNGRTLSY